ncbi:MAG: DUF4367 domain-containing protein [Oscillospiraceae bacterium]|jgi:hypothetical protein|nr:DUF4367 domain-containing protein [Oscillospiraceae bacterium]
MYKKEKTYAYLNHLSTEQLEALLCADSMSTETGNDDMIFHILDIVETREHISPTGRLPDVEASWKDFQKFYNPSEGESRLLYLGTQSDPSYETNDNLLSAKGPKTRRHARYIVLCAAIIVCFAVFVMPSVFGYSTFLEMIGYWTDEQLYFTGAGSGMADPQTDDVSAAFTDLQDALTHYGIHDTVVPQYIPDGFELLEIWVQEFPDLGDLEFSAPYVKGPDNIVISVYHSSHSRKIYEKNDQAVEQYRVGNTEHYIFSNNNNITAAWYTNSLECSISTTLPVENLKEIIDSIYW